MQGKTGELTFGAVMTALGTLLLAVGAMMPTLRLALLCVAGLCAVAAQLRGGKAWGWSVFALTSVLALLVSPGKGVPFGYVTFAGWYPLCKLRLEQRGRPWQRWGIKLLLFNVPCLLLLYAGGEMMGGALMGKYSRWALWAIANGAFAAYDMALSQVILLYMRKLSGRI